MMEGFILSDLQAFLYLTTYLIHAELIYEKMSIILENLFLSLKFLSYDSLLDKEWKVLDSSSIYPIYCLQNILFLT